MFWFIILIAFVVNIGNGQECDPKYPYMVEGDFNITQRNIDT